MNALSELLSADTQKLSESPPDTRKRSPARKHLLELIHYSDLSKVESGHLKRGRRMQWWRKPSVKLAVKAAEKEITLTVEGRHCFPASAESDPARLRQIVPQTF
jgi:hypothetical protein